MKTHGPERILQKVYILNEKIFLRAAACMFLLNRIAGPKKNSISTSTKAMAYNTCAPVQRGSAERAVTIPPYHQGECLDFAKLKAAKFPIGIQSLMKPVFFVDRFFGQHQWPLLVIICISVPRGLIT